MGTGTERPAGSLPNPARFTLTLAILSGATGILALVMPVGLD